MHGAKVTLTDCATMLPLLRRNVAANFSAEQVACGTPCLSVAKRRAALSRGAFELLFYYSA